MKSAKYRNLRIKVGRNNKLNFQIKGLIRGMTNKYANILRKKASLKF